MKNNKSEYQRQLMVIDNEIKISHRGIKHLQSIKKKIQKKIVEEKENEKN